MGERGFRQEGDKVVWEKPEPINDFTVWLKIKREFEEMFNCAFRMKEDDDDNLTVIFDDEAYVNNKEGLDLSFEDIKKHIAGLPRDKKKKFISKYYRFSRKSNSTKNI